MSKKVRFSLIQYPITPNFSVNQKRALTRLHGALSSRPRYIVLPEMWLGAPRHKGEREKWAQDYMRALHEVRNWAVNHRTGLFFSQLEKSGSRFFNTAYYIEADGKIKGRYRKIHLFSLGGETAIYSPGSQLGLFKTPFGIVGLVICYDIRFPELIRSLAVRGVRLLIVPARWPAIRNEHWVNLLCARAIENQIFVIGVNRIGNSLVFNPWGRKILQMAASRSLGTCDLDLNEVTRIRKKYPFFRERKLV